MNHADIQKHMADYLEGDLSLDRRALLDAHLDECEACARELAGMRATIALLRSLPDPEIPAGLADNVMRRVRAGEGRWTWLDHVQSAVSFLISPPVLAPVSAAMLGAGILLAAGQIQLGIPDPEPAAPAHRIAASQPAPSPARAASSGLAESDVLPAGARPIGASAAEAPESHAHSSRLAAGDSRGSQRRVILFPHPAVMPPPGTTASENAAHEFAALVDMLHAHQQVPRPPLARSPQSVQVSGGAARARADRSIGGAGLSRGLGTAALSSALPGGSELPSADEWLVLVQRSPSAFADRLAVLSLAEQELWVDHLARRAVELGSLEELLSVLRASSNDRARILADDFAAAGHRSAAEAQAASRGDSSGLPD